MEFKCPECPLTFKTKRARTIHRVQQHCATTLICDMCDTFECPKKDDFLLRYHRLKMHGGGRPYTCPHGCGYAGRDITALRVHKLHAHSEARPFGCTEPGCKKAYKSKWSLTQHAARYHKAAPCGSSTTKCGASEASQLCAQLYEERA